MQKISQFLRPQIWRRTIAIPLGLATAYACFLWYHVLVARGFGYILKSVKYTHPFSIARLIVLCLTIPALLTYPLIRNSLSRWSRIYFIVILGVALGLLIVPEFLETYAPAPWWHF
jgi:hypothetical protein